MDRLIDTMGFIMDAHTFPGIGLLLPLRDSMALDGRIAKTRGSQFPSWIEQLNSLSTSHSLEEIIRDNVGTFVVFDN